jgi:HlyD family secretion protein
MQKNIFPAEILPYTTESYLPRVSVRSQLIYLTVIGLLAGALASLPFIYVDISFHGSGVIRPVAEKNDLKSLVAGTVSSVQVVENQNVQAGQVLVTLQTDLLDNKVRLNESRQHEKQLYIRDLSQLVRLTEANATSLSGLTSPLYRQQYAQFVFFASESLQTQQKRQRELEIDRKLFAEKVIAQREFENKEFEYQAVRAQYRTLIEKQLSQWQGDLTAIQLELTQLQSEEKQLQKEKELYQIKAPLTGAVGQLVGLSPGSYVQAGEVLGTISPDATLIAECYVSPKDIGHLRPGMPVRFQVDAFNYNEWGLIHGVVQEVSSDYSLMDNQPVFKVKCRLGQNFLQLKNGYKGTLKKGMTLRAHFTATRRSLWQLLYDKADDWMNPVQTS